MNIVTQIQALKDPLTAFRRDLHAHPELGFEEFRTAERIAAHLENCGLAVFRAIAGTGVVAVLKGDKPGTRAVMLRADMDCLPISDDAGLGHSSTLAGKAHACGHDGHVAMLLGAAQFMAERRDFGGTIIFTFQPAEEIGGGAERMIAEGFFDKFPCDAVFGLHNWPGLPAGTLAVAEGPVLASVDDFEIRVRGRGGHAAYPHHTVDPVLTGSEIVLALQSIISREIDPQKGAVLSVTTFHAGDVTNVIPDNAVLSGTVRCFDPDVRAVIEKRVKEVATGVAAMRGGSADVDYRRYYPPTISSRGEAEVAWQAAIEVVGEADVQEPTPSMGSEDFAYFLQKRPGAFALLGVGDARGGLHTSTYDFNDDVIPVGVAYWTALARRFLAQAAG